MVELIIEVLKKEKNKLFRTLLLFCIVALFLVSFLPDNENYPYINILIAAMLVILAMLTKVVGEAIRIKLPRAKNKTESILFVIDTEDELYYRDVENKFVKEFEKNSYYQDNKSFHAICINQNKLKCRELSDKNSTIELLKKVNCIFLVRVTHRVQSTKKSVPTWNTLFAHSSTLISPENKKKSALKRLILISCFYSRALKNLFTKIKFLS